MITAGVDSGTKNTKAALLEDGKKVLATSGVRTGFDFAKSASEAYDQALAHAGLGKGEVAYLTATGFGRYRIPFRDVSVTDITANAKGARLLCPKTTCVLDVGAGNARASRVDEGGKIVNFKSTEKCAAGGGGFLEKIAFYTSIELKDLGDVALRSANPVVMSTVCSVLAESEVINLVTQEVPMEDILMGAHSSVAGRVVLTLKQVGVQPEVTLTGGLVMNAAFVRALEEKLKMGVNSSRELYYAGALGAALLGYRRLMKKSSANGVA